MNRVSGWVRSFDPILIGIVSLGLALRLWGVNYQLPYLYHPDESATINIALRMLHTGDLNPAFYHWPSFTFYLNSFAYWVYFALGALTGRFVSPNDLPYPDMIVMAVGKTSVPDLVVVSRGLMAFFGSLSVIAITLSSGLLRKNQMVIFLAGLLLAVDPVSVKNSHIIHPDTVGIFFALFAFLFALKIVDEPRTGYYIAAGLAAGIAASCKYNLALIIVPVFVAHFCVFLRAALWRWELYLACIAALVGFFVFSPYALLDWSIFLKSGIAEDAAHYAGGHAGAEGNSFVWYVGFLWETQRFAFVAACLEIYCLIREHQARGLVILAFPLTYFAFVSLFQVHFDTTILPVIPFLALLAALFSYRIARGLKEIVRVPSIRSLVPLLFCSVLVLPLLVATITNDRLMQEPDGRDHARIWIESNLPGGSRIAIESYAPYVERSRFVTEGFGALLGHPPEWYVANGFEYLVLGEGLYGRYLSDPVRYPEQVRLYEKLFSAFSQVSSFDQNGYEVRIYKTNVVIPPNRVSARYGDYGELVELIGYDDIVWEKGKPLKIKMTWRTLGEKPEPFQVSLRLLDQDESEIAMVREDLFQGKGWRSGMFEGTWIVTPPVSTLPGAYRLEVDLIWTRFDYRLPVKTWTGQAIDSVMLDSLQLKDR